MTRGRSGRLSLRKRDEVNSSRSKGLNHSAGHGKLQVTKCTPFKLATDERCSPRHSPFPPALSQHQYEHSPRRNQASGSSPRPKSCDPTPTRVKPFNLVCVFQHEQHQIKMQVQRQKQEAEERERRQFKARPYSPLRVNCHTPRSPSTPSKAPTALQPFDLESPKRHEDYVNFRFPEKLAKEEELRREQERQSRRKEAQRAAEIKSLRKSLLFKARPAPDMQQFWVPDLSGARPCTSFEPFHLTPTST